MDLGRQVTVRQLPVLGPERVAYARGFAAAARVVLGEADVAHVHSIFTYPAHVALREARALKLPTIVRPCGQLHRYSLRRSWWQKRAYLTFCGKLVRSACRAWHYTSENEAAESWPWDNSPRFVLPNGIEPTEYAIERKQARAAVAASLTELGGSAYVLFLGRLHPKKRLDLLLQAFLAGAPPDFKLVVVGPDEGKLWDALKAEYLVDSSAERRVLRLGTVTGSEKSRLLAGACLFALPSEHENFGIAALEALAVGTPVVLSPHVDLAEAAMPEGIAYTAPLDCELWKQLFASLLADPESLEKHAEEARAWACENYSWSHIAIELTRHYEWVTAGCPAHVAGERGCVSASGH
jgi:glycosyltransferase involved in cell wall biosynthesis